MMKNIYKYYYIPARAESLKHSNMKRKFYIIQTLEGYQEQHTEDHRTTLPWPHCWLTNTTDWHQYL